jgi:predicted nuclease of predicted toxin-antitoxin system
MGVSPRTVAFLRELGHEAVRLNEIGLDHAVDADVVGHAVRHGQIVLTFDLDYPALLTLQPARRTSAIVFRTVNADPMWVNSRLSQSLPLIQEVLEQGAIVVVEDARVRIRRYLDL